MHDARNTVSGQRPGLSVIICRSALTDRGDSSGPFIPAPPNPSRARRQGRNDTLLRNLILTHVVVVVVGLQGCHKWHDCLL